MPKFNASYAYDISCYFDFVVEAENEEEAEKKIEEALKAKVFNGVTGDPCFDNGCENERVFTGGPCDDADAACRVTWNPTERSLEIAGKRVPSSEVSVPEYDLESCVAISKAERSTP